MFLWRPSTSDGSAGSVCGIGGVDTGGRPGTCLLYTSDAADERSSVDLGGRRIIKKKKNKAWVHKYECKI